MLSFRLFLVFFSFPLHPSLGIIRWMLSAWLAGQDSRNARTWPRSCSRNGWTLIRASEYINHPIIPTILKSIALYSKCDHLPIMIIYRTNLGSTPTCVPLCTATPSQQVALKSGTLPGHNFRTPPLPLKLTNCALPWPARRNPRCSAGLLTDSLNTVIHNTAAYVTTSYWQASTLPTVTLAPFQVPGVHSGPK